MMSIRLVSVDISSAYTCLRLKEFTIKKTGMLYDFVLFLCDNCHIKTICMILMPQAIGNKP